MTRNRADQVVKVSLNNLKDLTELDNLFSELKIFENRRPSFRSTIIAVPFVLSAVEISGGFVELSSWVDLIGIRS